MGGPQVNKKRSKSLLQQMGKKIIKKPLAEVLSRQGIQTVVGDSIRKAKIRKVEVEEIQEKDSGRNPPRQTDIIKDLHHQVDTDKTLLNNIGGDPDQHLKMKRSINRKLRLLRDSETILHHKRETEGNQALLRESEVLLEKDTIGQNHRQKKGTYQFSHHHCNAFLWYLDSETCKVFDSTTGILKLVK